MGADVSELTELTLAEIQDLRAKGAELAWLEQAVEGAPKRYLLMAYEVYPNGTTSSPIEDREEADLIGRLAGLGPAADPAGFAIWPVDDTLPWRRLRGWATSVHKVAVAPFVKAAYGQLLRVMDELQGEPKQ
jgi:hypothetical protein